MKYTRTALALLAVLIGVLGVAIFATSCRQEAVTQGVSNFTGLEVDVPSSDSTVGLDIDQNGTSDIVSFKDGGTEVFDIPDGGVADFKANAVSNLGAAGTDFSASGGLTLAAGLTISAGGADVTGDLTLENDETISNGYNGVITYTATTHYMSGALQVSGLTKPSFADETITNGEWVTPTVTVMALDSASWVTMTLGSGCTEGQYLELIGDDANNIFINDTNIRTSDGNGITLNQYDVVGWRCQDDEWLELFKITNS